MSEAEAAINVIMQAFRSWFGINLNGKIETNEGLPLSGMVCYFNNKPSTPSALDGSFNIKLRPNIYQVDVSKKGESDRRIELVTNISVNVKSIHLPLIQINKVYIDQLNTKEEENFESNHQPETSILPESEFFETPLPSNEEIKISNSHQIENSDDQPSLSNALNAYSPHDFEVFNSEILENDQIEETNENTKTPKVHIEIHENDQNISAEEIKENPVGMPRVLESDSDELESEEIIKKKAKDAIQLIFEQFEFKTNVPSVNDILELFAHEYPTIKDKLENIYSNRTRYTWKVFLSKFIAKFIRKIESEHEHEANAYVESVKQSTKEAISRIFDNLISTHNNNSINHELIFNQFEQDYSDLKSKIESIYQKSSHYSWRNFVARYIVRLEKNHNNSLDEKESDNNDIDLNQDFTREELKNKANEVIKDIVYMHMIKVKSWSGSAWEIMSENYPHLTSKLIKEFSSEKNYSAKTFINRSSRRFIDESGVYEFDRDHQWYISDESVKDITRTVIHDLIFDSGRFPNEFDPDDIYDEFTWNYKEIFIRLGEIYLESKHYSEKVFLKKIIHSFYRKFCNAFEGMSGPTLGERETAKTRAEALETTDMDPEA